MPSRRERMVKMLVDKFLAWPLPDSVCSDLCATKQGYPHRSGTSLLTADEARQMLEYLLEEMPNAALRQTIEQQAQEIEQMKAELAHLQKYHDLGRERLRQVTDMGIALEQQLAAMTQERDAFKALAESNARSIEDKGKQLATAQHQYNELTKEGGELHSLQISNAQLQARVRELEREANSCADLYDRESKLRATLHATLAAREERIKELEVKYGLGGL